MYLYFTELGESLINVSIIGNRLKPNKNWMKRIKKVHRRCIERSKEKTNLHYPELFKLSNITSQKLDKKYLLKKIGLVAFNICE